MPAHPGMLVSYVADIERSTAFYEAVLGSRPVEQSPTFVLFALDTNLKLGLWKKDGVQPAAMPPGGSELVILQPDKAAVDTYHTRWRNLGATIIQTPVKMDFGYAFTATDPDGHRLRVMTCA